MKRPILRVVGYSRDARIIAETMADVAGWTPLEPASASSNPYVVAAWEPAEPDGSFLWLDDPIVGWQYGLYMGSCHEVLLSDLAMLEQEEDDCRLLTPQDVFEWIGTANGPKEVGAAGRLLGLFACGPFDPETFKVLAGLLHCHHADMQRNALIALKYTGWTEFDAELAKLSSDPETDDGVKADAVKIREVLASRDYNADYRPDEG